MRGPVRPPPVHSGSPSARAPGSTASPLGRVSVLSSLGRALLGRTIGDPISGERLRFTLVYPHDASTAGRRVSVLSPIGCAMLGASVGEVIQLRWPNGYRRELAIEAVPFQPEADGQYWL